MFWKRKETVITPTPKEEIAQLVRKMGVFEARMMDLEMSYDILRDKVLRKLQMKRHNDEENAGDDKRIADGLPRFKI